MMRAAWIILILLANVTHAADLNPVAASAVWARATPPGSTVGVVYARLISTQADELISIETPVAARAEIHVTSHEGGTMMMRPMMSLQLPANESIRLHPGGIHVMLTGLRKPLQAGASFPMTLSFRSSGPLTITAKVIGPGEAEPSK